MPFIEGSNITFSKKAIEVLSEADYQAHKLGHLEMGGQHVILALYSLDSPYPKLSGILAEMYQGTTEWLLPSQYDLNDPIYGPLPFNEHLNRIMKLASIDAEEVARGLSDQEICLEPF